MPEADFHHERLCWVIDKSGKAASTTLECPLSRLDLHNLSATKIDCCCNGVPLDLRGLTFIQSMTGPGPGPSGDRRGHQTLGLHRAFRVSLNLPYVTFIAAEHPGTETANAYPSIRLLPIKPIK